MENGGAEGSGEEEEDACSDVTVSVDPIERYVMGTETLRIHGFPVPPRRREQQVRSEEAAWAR